MSDFESSAHRARELYSENIELPFADLIRTLVVDSSFLIKFFRGTICSRESEMPFKMHGFPDLVDDLVVIRNQIPFLF